MIIIYHQNNVVTSIWNNSISADIPVLSKQISEVLFQISKAYPNAFIVWCNNYLKAHLNIKEFQEMKLKQNTLVSFNINKTPYLTDAIGFVNETPFINVNRRVLYPTWLMSSDVGGVHASILSIIESKITLDANFNYFLNSLAKLSMPFGVLCYSNPKLLKFDFEGLNKHSYNASLITLFRFVKQHYKAVWVFLLFIDFILYERKVPFLALFLSLFYKQRSLNNLNFGTNNSKSLSSIDTKDFNIDVVIPTIGRKKYLFDTLKCLSHQTLLPKQVIIVEQNPEPNATSELDFLTNEIWPFKIQHHFTHQAGACNARNIALNEIKSEWVFLADDDIVLKNDFIEEASKVISNSKQKAFTFRCYLKEETPVFKTVKQWESFGSGCSIVKAKAIEDIRFDMGFEFGFGEDADFGMQIRNKGIDVIYLPEPSILHLKAPMGGFRTKPELLWQNDKVQPKPSPTISLFLKKHFTTAQILGYKTTLFLKYYRVQNIKNPFKYYKTFGKQWERSQYWANQLMQKQD